jgi:hypothetical protein
MTHAATSKVENSAQGSSCKLKFVHGLFYLKIGLNEILIVKPFFSKKFESDGWFDKFRIISEGAPRHLA